jgi:phenylacetate-CoA ligase
MLRENSAVRNLYDSLPAEVQSLGVSALGWNIRRTRYGDPFERAVRRYTSQQWRSAEQWESYQRRKLDRLLDMAARHTEHYSSLDDIDTTGGDVHEMLADVPFLDKERLRTEPGTLVSENADDMETLTLKTSGTTGTPTATHHSRRSHCLYWAAMERFWRWGGCRYGDRRVSFTGNRIVPADDTEGPFGRLDRANNRLLMSSYHLGENTVDDYLDRIAEFDPDFIDGYPSSIGYCAQRAAETERDIEIPACFPTAETLRPADRESIEQGFSTRVYNQYGSTESACLITECSAGTLHINPEIGVVEILDDEGESVDEGEIGELVLTGLNNTAMPLIRYRIGDLARRGPRRPDCACGREMPVVEELIGRQDEVVVTADGRRVPMLSYNVFKWTSGIEESQIIQRSVDEFELRIVPGEGFSEDQSALAVEKLEERVGEDIHVDVETLREIPKTEGGKFRAVISDVDE